MTASLAYDQQSTTTGRNGNVWFCNLTDRTCLTYGDLEWATDMFGKPL